jgi:hypothetical protein
MSYFAVPVRSMGTRMADTRGAPVTGWTLGLSDVDWCGREMSTGESCFGDGGRVPERMSTSSG